jgi:hypothetical protein
MDDILGRIQKRLNKTRFTDSWVLDRSIRRIPESPTTMILSFPIVRPVSVNNLRRGILTFGMTSWGKLESISDDVGTWSPSS